MLKGCSDLIPVRTVDPEVFADMDNFDLVNNPTAFAKSLRLQFPKFSKGFTTADFEEFVQDHVGVENLKSIGRLNFPNEWQMEVESQEVREKLIRWGKTKIKNRSCWISPLCTSEIRGFVHWLPNKVPNQKVKDLLSEFGEVLFVENQKQTLWSGKVTSDSRYYALYLRAGKAKEDLPHFIKIEDFNVLVTVRGRNPACFHCRETGHRKNECKKFKEKLNSFCQRPAKSANKRRKPRGNRYTANAESEDATEVAETPTENSAETSSGAKQKSAEPKQMTTEPKQMATEPKQMATEPKQLTTVPKQKINEPKQKAAEPKTVTDNKKEKITNTNASGLAELVSVHISNLQKEILRSLASVETAASSAAADAEEVEKKKKRKKKKNKKKSAADPSES